MLIFLHNLSERAKMLFFPPISLFFFLFFTNMYIYISSIYSQIFEQHQSDTRPESSLKVSTGCLRSSARTIMTTDLMEYHQPCQVNHTTPLSLMASYGPL